MTLMSEQVDVATVASATDAGIDDLLLKPIDVSDLRVRLGVAERVQVFVSQLDEQTNAVRFHASHDSLTGLWNRESLLNLLFPETDRVQRMRTPLCTSPISISTMGMRQETRYCRSWPTASGASCAATTSSAAAARMSF